MQDTVFINKLEVSTIIGVYDFERDKPQRVLIDLQTTADLEEAGRSDKLINTVDYGALVTLIEKLAKENTAELLECFGQTICDEIFAQFTVNQITLTLHKPDIIENVNSVGIILRRQRPHPK